MPLTAYAAGWFLIAALPISFWVAWSDLRSMKIPNYAVYALLCSYAVLGLIALPFEQYLWHWTHAAVMLVVGMALWAARAMGAGDSKFIAAAAPMVAFADWQLMVLILSATMLAGVAAHRIAKHTPIRSMVPDWESWDPQKAKKFPMGFPLGMSLVFYLGYVFFTR